MKNIWARLLAVALGLQALISIGNLNFFLTMMWGYDGSGGVRDQMYIRQLFYDIAAIYFIWSVLFAALLVTCICFITAIAGKIRRKRQNATPSKLFNIFFIITIVNAIFFSLIIMFLFAYFG